MPEYVGPPVTNRKVINYRKKRFFPLQLPITTGLLNGAVRSCSKVKTRADGKALVVAGRINCHREFHVLIAHPDDPTQRGNWCSINAKLTGLNEPQLELLAEAITSARRLARTHAS